MRLAAAFAVLFASTAAADTILSAEFADPTTRYAHGVLGDAVEWGSLQITVGASVGDDSSLFSANRRFTYNITLPEDRVFEDLAPRLWDVTGDGAPEVVVVLSRVDLGASLVILGMVDGKPQQIASTPHIGRANRWLAPVGAADLDGDGRIEIAYVDRPHLAKTLRIWNYTSGGLTEVGSVAGVTNHRIGQDFIQSGVRDCGDGPEFVMADAQWTRVVAVTGSGGQFTARSIAPYAGPDDINAALVCN